MAASSVTLLLLLLLAATRIAVRGTVVKSWGLDRNVDTDANWAGGRRPCPGQVAHFPQHRPLAVYVQRRLLSRQLVLPTNGEMMLADGAYVAFTDSVSPADTRCQHSGGGTVTFDAGDGSSWFDAGSWRQRFTPSPVPHAERVPCPSDHVLFPDNITYRALVDRPVTVAALTLGPHAMNSHGFGVFRATSLGRALFDVKQNFTISSPASCDAECVCGNDRPSVLATICAATRCRPAQCSGAVEPAGHCCHMCGSFVRVSASGESSVAEVSDLIRSDDGSSGSVHWHVGRTHDGQVQAVLVDLREGVQDSSRIALSLRDKLAASGRYDMRTVVVGTSGPRHAPLVAGSGSGSGSVAGIVVGVLLLLLFAGLLVCAVKTDRLPLRGGGDIVQRVSEWRPARLVTSLTRRLPDWQLDLRARVASAASTSFRFARFRNDASGQVELGQRAEQVQELPDDQRQEQEQERQERASSDGSSEAPTRDAAAEPRLSRSFVNPMYREPWTGEENSPTSSLAAGSVICITPDGKAVANPFFGLPDISVVDVDTQANPAESAAALAADSTEPQKDGAAGAERAERAEQTAPLPARAAAE